MFALSGRTAWRILKQTGASITNFPPYIRERIVRDESTPEAKSTQQDSQLCDQNRGRSAYKVHGMSGETSTPLDTHHPFEVHRLPDAVKLEIIIFAILGKIR
jgi:hypothetical protein